MLCKFDYDEDVLVCSVCGFTRKMDTLKQLPFYRNCNVQPPEGIGDWIAKLQIVRRMSHLLRLKHRGCGCATRQAALNRWFPFDRTAWRVRFRWLWWIVRR